MQLQLFCRILCFLKEQATIPHKVTLNIAGKCQVCFNYGFVERPKKRREMEFACKSRTIKLGKKLHEVDKVHTNAAEN